MTPGRIDVHHHAIVPRVAALMRRMGAPFKIPWTLAETFEVLAEQRIDYAVISNPIPVEYLPDAATAKFFCREANEAVAEFAAAHPGRFGLLAALPIPHIDAALAEIEYARETLGADGFVLIPHSGSDYLGDALFEPVLAELDRRGAVVLVHPMMPPDSAGSSVPAVLADFLLDTTRGAIGLVLSEALDRYPNISFVLAHAGGFLPYAAFRVEALAHGFFGADPVRIREQLGRFYYDTALAGPSALPGLFATVPPDRILFGTDWCAAPHAAVTAAGRALEEQYARLPGAAAAGERTARRLFTGWAAGAAPSPDPVMSEQ
ncbi:amidohydrolase family protein [Nocardia vulneris]|uniref:Amidohydrolase n=1 Tax=Nocardia vulneris TaxID=1141657 RepID=A0ABR4ZJG1_9NOCA|nr:amidohydrolase family protein [Nocardia vulneris]KIA65453.1 amidohydrolase [Nocardia vulneris]